MAEKYYQLVKENKEKSEEAINVKKELDAIEAEFSEILHTLHYLKQKGFHNETSRKTRSRQVSLWRW